MKQSEILSVGDTVLWRGAFGTDPAKPAVILGIEVTAGPREKDGCPVDSVEWATVRANRAIVTLQGDGCDFENWAYGEQISPSF